MFIIKDLIPKFYSNSISDKVYFLNDCCPVKEVRNYDSDFDDQTNNWLQDKLSEILNKRGLQDANLEDKEVLCLFRLLALKFRIHHPLNGERLKVDPGFEVFFECWIIAAVVDYFLHVSRLVGMADNVNDGKGGLFFGKSLQVNQGEAWRSWNNTSAPKQKFAKTETSWGSHR